MLDVLQAIEQLAQCGDNERRLLISWNKQTGWNATLSGETRGKVLGSARNRATAEEAIRAALSAPVVIQELEKTLKDSLP